MQLPHRAVTFRHARPRGKERGSGWVGRGGPDRSDARPKDGSGWLTASSWELCSMPFALLLT